MRKITEQAVNAFKAGGNFKGSNTIVETRQDETFLYLHGNMIAHSYTVKEKEGEVQKLFISTCGWESNTTKERLNGVLSAFNLPTIYQENWTWFFTDGDQFKRGTRVFKVVK